MGTQTTSIDNTAYTSGTTRAERLVADLSAWLERPIDRIIAVIGIRKNHG